MKTYSLVVLALLGSVDARHHHHPSPRRLDTTLGMFAQDEGTYQKEHSNDIVQDYQGGDLATRLGIQGLVTPERIEGVDFDLQGGQREFGMSLKSLEPPKKK